MRTVTIVAIFLLASAAAAHEGVKNPAVMARMDAMKSIGAEMKTLGQMAKGASAFNAGVAKSAAAEIANHAAATPMLFESPEGDPKSEAAPEIWERFDDFAMRSEELQRLAAGFSVSIETEADLTEAMTAMGATCKACHKDYRLSR